MRFVRPLAAKASLGMAMLLAFLVSSPAQAQVLEQVPSDAMVVVKFRNLDQFSQKIAKFSKGMGLDQQVPELNDPLTSLAEEAKLSKGLNRGGDMVIAFLDPAKQGGDESKSVLILVPVADYQVFLTNFKATADAGNGITKATPQEGPEDVFVAKWGNFAAMSPGKEVLAAKPAGLKLSGLAQKESEAKDVLLYANMDQIRETVLPQLKEGREMMLAQIQQGLEDEGMQKFIPLAKVAANQFVNIAEQFLKDAHSATLSMNLTDAGITATAAAEFQPTSYLGKLALQVKPAEGSLLAGLPDRKYFLYAGGNSTPEVNTQLANDLLNPIIKELQAMEETAKFVQALEAAKKAYASTTGWSFGYVAPTAPLGQESVLQQVTVVRGDSKAIQDSQRTITAATVDLMKMMPQEQGQSVSMDIKPNAKTVAGVKFDVFETKMSFPEDDPQAQQAKQMLAAIYGPAGMTGVSGAIDAKTVVSVQGGSDELIADTVNAAKANADTLSARQSVSAVANQLPKNRSFVMFFDLATLVNTATRYAAGFGVPVNVKLPADLSPIGVSAATEQTALRVDLFVPDNLMKGLMSAALQAQRDMEGPDQGL